MKKILMIVAALAVLAAIGWRVQAGRGSATAAYRFVEIQRGDLTAVVASTGTLEPVVTVQVGTQVSGIVESIAADFNDRVAADQVIARIDTTLLASAVAAAEAQRERAEAELRQADREFRRISQLWDESLVAETELNSAQYALDVARASVKSASVDLERARRNLDYATIRAPIAGTVVDRAVDVGQTVQASFSAPELFQIAGDLTRMRILVAVDESDIGEIAEGQAVRFTVQAHPERTFTGTVRQVRLQSVTQENVVNYTTVVDVANDDGALLPGMTATVDFLVRQAVDVFHVPNAALRYKPDQETMTRVLAARRAERQAARGQAGGDGQAARTGGSNAGASSAERGLLWSLGADGELDVIPVRIGITDGTSTEVEGPGLTVGRQIIAGVDGSAAAAQASTPFQQERQRGGPPAPGGF